MKNLVYAKRINDSQLTGLIEIKEGSASPELYCYCSEEIANEILSMKKKSENWDKLDEEIGKFYENDTDDDDENYDEESEGSLLDIGEAAATAFGYL